MIVTLTANPSVDRTIELAEPLVRGAVQRGVTADAQPGGKGVNVTRALLACGTPSVAVLPGDPTDPLLVALSAAAVPVRALPIGAAIRTNVAITELDGTTTKVNEPGPMLSDANAAALIDLTVRTSVGADWLVLAGSLPPGLGDGFLVDVIRAVRAHAAASGTPAPRIALDASGAPFAAVLAAGEPVDLVKPNAEELAEAVGHGDEASFEAEPALAAAAAADLFDRGVGAALVTLGSRGALLVTADGAWHGVGPRIEARSTVGAGDCALAGYLHATTSGAGPTAALARAVAHGAAAASLPGTAVPTLADSHPDRITVTDVPRTAAGRV